LEAIGIAGTLTAGTVRAGTGADTVIVAVLAGGVLRAGRDGGMKSENAASAAIEQ
jgi:hypothetical protein